MTVEEANWDALSKRFPGIRQTIEADAAQEDSMPEVEFVRAKSGAWSARWQGKTLASAFDPQKEASKSVAALALEVDFVVVGGLGLGYHVQALAQAYPDLPILVAEPSARFFLETIRVVDLTELFRNLWVSWAIGGQASNVGYFLERFYCRSVAFVPYRPIWELNSQWMQNLEFGLNDFQAKARVNDQTLRRFYKLWFRNFHKNVARAENWKPVKSLFGTAKGKKAVVCAAGPSLESALDWVEKNRDKVVLIAVDTAWNALRSRQIVPDFLVFMDGQYWNSRHVDTAIGERTAVVAELCSHPSALRKAPGRTFVSSSSVPLLRDWENRTWGDLGVLKSGGSVTTSAWELALALGCSEVAFAGLDLGYPCGMTHAKGSQFEEMFHWKSSRRQPAQTLAFRLLQDAGLTKRPSVDGSFVLSDPRMDLYRDWLSRSFQENSHVRVVNLSTSGSLIAGAHPPGSDYGSNWERIDTVGFGNAKTLSPVSEKTTIDETLLDNWKRLTQRLESGSVSGNWTETLEEAYLQASASWGPSATRILLSSAYESFRYFPGPRSFRALKLSWKFVVEIAEFWRNLSKTDK